MRYVEPPERFCAPPDRISVFLAGSIDTGYAENWQKKIIDSNFGDSTITFYNPRREEWDSSWTQSIVNSKFTEQVNWELDYMDDAMYILMYIARDSKAPISLLEFGRIMASYPEKLIICVEDGFWRRGNIEVMCNRQRIVLHSELDKALRELQNRVINCVQQISR